MDTVNSAAINELVYNTIYNIDNTNSQETLKNTENKKPDIISTNTVGISLGWNCEAATYGVQHNIRSRKINGYKTCPFDECVTNYQGLIDCINDNFKYFLDINYLKIIKAPFATGTAVKTGDELLYNTKYNFLFNHESPGHGNLYISQRWSGGKYHYIQNNFKEFITRYKNRIDNFNKYLNDNENQITFILSRYNHNVVELEELLKNKYPQKKINIIKITPTNTKEFIRENLQLCNVNKKDIDNELIATAKIH